jgi:hypothetical protein
MILSAIAERLKHRSKDGFKGRYFEATLILQAVSGPVAKFVSEPGTGQSSSVFRLGCPCMAVVKCGPVRPIPRPFSNFATGPTRMRCALTLPRPARQSREPKRSSAMRSGRRMKTTTPRDADFVDADGGRVSRRWLPGHRLRRV